jgi:hypothetical protein
MLTTLQKIRSLLTSPETEDIRLANQHLLEVAQCLDNLSEQSSTGKKLSPQVLESLLQWRAELSAIATLSRSAANCFRRLSEARAADFGAYERTGTVKTLCNPAQMSVQL